MFNTLFFFILIFTSILQKNSGFLRVVEAAGLNAKTYNSCSFSSTYSKGFKRSYRYETESNDHDSEELSCSEIYVPLSEAYKCISSFNLDPENAKRHLRSVIEVMNHHYIFKDIAAKPLSSTPLKTPFDYTIYNGTDHGEFDLLSGLGDLLESIDSDNHTTLDVLLQMNALGAKVFDGHLSINNGISRKGILDNRYIFFYSGKIFDGTADKTKLSISFPTRSIEEEQSGFILTEEITLASSTKKAIIKKIDGKNPLEFLTGIATKPTGLFNYKSRGARVQALIKMMTHGVNDDEEFLAHFPLSSGSPDLSKLLKDEYKVQYEDGSTTTWKLMQNIPLPVTCDMTTSQIEAILGEPGKMHRDLESMKKAIYGSKFMLRRYKEMDDIKDQNDLVPTVARGFTRKQNSVGFTKEGSNLGYKVYDDFAVLKVATFSRGSHLDEKSLLVIWLKMLVEAKGKGVTKLIVDVIDNGGGTVNIGYFLAQLLYPNATWEELASPYDRLYTPTMLDDMNKLKSIMETYHKYLDNSTLMEQMTNALNKDPAFLSKKLDSILSLLESATDIMSSNEFLTESKYSFYLKGSVLGSIESVKQAKNILLQNIKKKREQDLSLSKSNSSEEEALDTAQFRTLWHILVSVANEIFAFPFKSYMFQERFKIDSMKRTEHIRGGKRGNYTSPFYTLDPNQLTRWHQLMPDEVKLLHFDHYIFLSSGNSCGSTTDTFKNTITAYAHTKNLENKGSNKSTTAVPPIHTVSFGGTGRKEDASTTQFSGGAMGTPSAASLYLPGLIFQALNTLLHSSISHDKLTSLLQKFHQAIPDACYYCDTPFSMPYYEIYSKITGVDGIPLEYVNEIPDFYIRQWPTKTSFSSDADLPILYQLTSRFFFRETAEKSSS